MVWVCDGSTRELILFSENIFCCEISTILPNKIVGLSTSLHVNLTDEKHSQRSYAKQNLRIIFKFQTSTGHMIISIHDCIIIWLAIRVLKSFCNISWSHMQSLMLPLSQINWQVWLFHTWQCTILIFSIFNYLLAKIIKKKKMIFWKYSLRQIQQHLIYDQFVCISYYKTIVKVYYMNSANNQTKSVNLGWMKYWRELWPNAKSIAVQLTVLDLYLQPCKRHHGFLCL